VGIVGEEGKTRKEGKDNGDRAVPHGAFGNPESAVDQELANLGGGPGKSLFIGSTDLPLVGFGQTPTLTLF
jgi:hypothetical protein